MSTRDLCILACLVMLSSISWPVTAANVEGFYHFNTADMHYEHLAQAADSDGRIWLLVAERQDRLVQGDKRLKLWQLDRAGERVVNRTIDSDDAGAGRYALFVDDSSGDVRIGIPTPVGPQILHVAAEAATTTQRFSDVSQSDAVWHTIARRGDGQVIAVTSRGASVFDAAEKNWRTEWRPDDGRLVIDAVVTRAGELGMLTAAFNEEQVRLRVVRLSTDGAPFAHGTELVPVGPDGLYAQLHSTKSGLAAVIPLGREQPLRWRLVAIDTDGNLSSAIDFEVPGVESIQSRFLALDDGWVVNDTSPKKSNVLVLLNDGLQVASRIPWPTDGDQYQRVRRTSVERGAGGAWIVLSIVGRHPDENRLRGEISVAHFNNVPP